jgi:hypothetical protein
MKQTLFGMEIKRPNFYLKSYYNPDPKQRAMFAKMKARNEWERLRKHNNRLYKKHGIKFRWPKVENIGRRDDLTTNKKLLKEIDPMIRKTMLSLNKKGYTTYGSCQGHAPRIEMYPDQNDPASRKKIKFLAPKQPYLAYRGNPNLNKAVTKAGFKITEIHRPNLYIARYPNKTTMKERKKLWGRFEKEAKKLPKLKRIVK